MGETSRPQHPPHAALERELIDEFLRLRGHTRETVRRLPRAEALTLMEAAASFASLRLAEIEARIHYVHELHGQE